MPIHIKTKSTPSGRPELYFACHGVAMTIVTEIPLDERLLEEAATLARELRIPPEKLFEIALESFVERHRVQQLRADLDLAYADPPDAEERKVLDGMKSHLRGVAAEW